MLAVIALGATAAVITSLRLERAQFNLSFLLLTLITLVFGSRVVVRIPRARSHISVSDTFVLLAILLFGGEAGITLAAFDGFFISRRTSKRTIVRAFNISVFISSTFVTVCALRLFFGPIPDIARER